MKKLSPRQRSVTSLITAALFLGAVTAIDYYSTFFRYEMGLMNPAIFYMETLATLGLEVSYMPILIGYCIALFFVMVPLGAYMLSKPYFDRGDRETGWLYFLTIVLPISVFGIEDVLWFRIFNYPMPMRLEWLDYSLTGLVGQLLGYGGASSASLIIVSSIGMAIVTFMWYRRLKNPLLFVNLGLFVLFALNVVPYLMLVCMGVVMLVIFLKPRLIEIKNMKRWTRSVQTAK